MITIGETAIFVPQPSLEDSGKFYPIFTLMDFETTVVYREKSSALHPAPSLEVQIPVFMILSDRVTQL
jgi:hypothetical protein